MIADIKYTVKYHSLLTRKIGMFLCSFGVIVIVLLDLIWTPFRGMIPELQALLIMLIIPKFFWHLHLIALLSMVLGGCFLLLRWRTGKLEITDEKLFIYGSYNVSIWLKNIWEIDFLPKWKIRLDSNVDAIEINFKTEREFKLFSERLIQVIEQFDSIKIKPAS